MSIALPTYLNPSAVRRAALQALLVACVWVFFYHVSVDGTAYFAFNHETFWVFLPAGVRLVAVILFGWVGVVGLFIGSALTPDAFAFGDVLMLSAVSALAPKLALISGRRLLHLSPTLASLKPFHLGVLALIASSYSALMRVGALHLLGNPQPVFNLLPMFVGDLVGTFLIFYLCLALLWSIGRWSRWASWH
jgi:hypothetical protein